MVFSFSFFFSFLFFVCLIVWWIGIHVSSGMPQPNVCHYTKGLQRQTSILRIPSYLFKAQICTLLLQDCLVTTIESRRKSLFRYLSSRIPNSFCWISCILKTYILANGTKVEIFKSYQSLAVSAQNCKNPHISILAWKKIG